MYRSQATNKCKILSLNANSLAMTNTTKFKILLHNTRSFDIVCLQETRINAANPTHLLNVEKSMQMQNKHQPRKLNSLSHKRRSKYIEYLRTQLQQRNFIEELQKIIEQIKKEKIEQGKITVETIIISRYIDVRIFTKQY